MGDDTRYVYLEDDEEGIRVWPLEDSGVTWKGKPVLTRNHSHVLRAEEEIVGYETGKAGYHLAALDGPLWRTASSNLGLRRTPEFREARAPEG